MSGHTFRVFVSSTFSDLKAERDALQRHVWPALDELCRRHGSRFQAVDLRWGVSEEAGLDQRTMSICLTEIVRCREMSPRPNFLVLLGDRYGWRPLPAVIPAHEMEILRRQLSDHERDRLIWGEDRPTDRNGWYRRDDNAAPPEFVLLPREPGSRWADSQSWAELERELIDSLERAARVFPEGTLARLKYGTSATEQEIQLGALTVPDAAEHVHCFFRSIDDLPLAAAGERQAEFRDDDRARVDDVPDPDRRASRDRLLGLKQSLSDALPANIHAIGGVRWLPSGDRPRLPDGSESPISLDHIEAFRAEVFEAIAGTIRSELARSLDSDPLLAEEDAHDRHRRQRCEVFVGRRDVLGRIADYLRDGTGHPLLIHGPSGSGKSALLARAATDAWESHGGIERPGIGPTGLRIVVRFIAATPGSTQCRQLLHGLCQQLSRDYPGGPVVPEEFNDLVQDLRDRLNRASAAEPLVIFLDALDQLDDSDGARSLYWLPTELPPHVRLVVTVLSDPLGTAGDCYRAIEPRLSDGDRVPLADLEPEEAAELLDLWLRSAGRTLVAEQRDEVLGKPGIAGNPLALWLAFEAARSWRSFTPMAEVRLASDAPGIVRDLLRRLAADANHGPILVERSLALLAAARNGLAEDEMLDLLSPVPRSPPGTRAEVEDDRAVLADYRRRSPHSPPVDRLPHVLWSRLANDLRPYLVERRADGGVLLSFYHRLIREVVEAEYLADPVRRARHAQLADYFSRQPLESPAETSAHGSRPIANLRKLSELPFAQLHAGEYGSLIETLTSARFGEVKVRGQGVRNLIAEYDLVLRHRSDDPGRVLEAASAGLKSIRSALRLAAHALSRDGGLYRSQLVGRLLGNDLPEARTLVASAREGSETPWLEPLSPFLTRPGGPLTDTWTAPRVSSVTLDRSGKLAASGARDGSITFWDVGESRRLHTFSAHAGGVSAVTFSRDGCLLASSGDDIRIWGFPHGKLLRTFDATGTTRVRFTPDGTRLVSGSSDGTLKIWDLSTGTILREIGVTEDRTTGITALAIAGDSRRAICSTTGAFTGWHIDSGEPAGAWPGFGTCTAVALSDDGRWALAAFLDELSLWDLDRNRKVGQLIGHVRNKYINDLAISADARTAISAGEDGSLRLWDLSKGKLLASLGGHSAPVPCVALAPDARLALSCGGGVINVWDLVAAREADRNDPPSDRVWSVCIAGRSRAIAGTNGGVLGLWDLTTRSRVAIVTVARGPVCDLDSHPSSPYFVSASLDVSLSEAYDLSWVAWSRRGSGFVTRNGSTDCTITSWDVETGRPVTSWQGHDGQFIRSVAVFPDGRRMATAASDGTIRIWEPTSGICLGVLEGHEHIVWALSVSPDGTRLVSASFDDSIRLWDPDTGRCLRVMQDPGVKPRVVSYTRNGTRIISGSEEGSVTVRATDTGEVTHRRDSDHGEVAGLAVCPGDARVVVTYQDRLLELLTIPDLRVVAEFRFDRTIGRVTVTPDGREALVGDAAGQVCFIRLPGV